MPQEVDAGLGLEPFDPEIREPLLIVRTAPDIGEYVDIGSKYKKERDFVELELPSEADDKNTDRIKMGLGSDLLHHPDMKYIYFQAGILEKHEVEEAGEVTEEDPDPEPIITEVVTEGVQNDSYPVWSVLLDNKLAAMAFITMLQEIHGLVEPPAEPTPK